MEEAVQESLSEQVISTCKMNNTTTCKYLHVRLVIQSLFLADFARKTQ